ncbi:MAG TPA: exodeoxyribonuclease VII small subunit [Candidatus Polarisedimenticolia bacterium]|nr:exodeoxyribonuclease VII small subunit [Candidatus Polarisedimenticolia bacterium]
MPKTSKKGTKEPRFEEALSGLETIVSRLEAGELPLDDALKLFEEGVRLARVCGARLDEAERRIEILMKGADGELTVQEFDDGETELSDPNGEDPGADGV